MHDYDYAAKRSATPDRLDSCARHPAGSVALGQHVRPGPLVGRAEGFTLVEAIIALTLSSLIVGLVTSVFLAQNAFYASVVERSEVQDNLRSVTQLIASEVRGVAPGGVIVADSTRFAFRVPMRVGGICDTGRGALRIPRFPQMSTADVSGYAVHDAAGDWDFRALAWALLFDESRLRNAEDCAANGADTTGIVPDFLVLFIAGPITLGDVVMIYREVEFSIATSTLDPTTLGLYRGKFGSPLVEFASGLNAVTHFQYRLGTPTYQTSVLPANLPLVDGIRIIVVSESSRTATGGYTYGWSVDIPFKNSR